MASLFSQAKAVPTKPTTKKSVKTEVQLNGLDAHKKPKECRIMDAKQFAWLYLLEHGVAGRQHSYYGGWKILQSAKKRFPNLKSNDLWKTPDPIAKLYLHEIKIYGVNWVKTRAPSNSSASIFNGTFADSGEKEILEGTLVLTNGSTQEWVADKLEVSNVFEMMAQVSNAEIKFVEIFGK